MRRVLLLRALALLALAWMWVSSPAVLNAADETDSHAEHTEAHDDGHPAPSINDLIYPAINFSIYLFIVWKYVPPAIMEYLRRRHSDVVRTASEAGEALARAEKILAGNRARLTALPAEADGIRQDLVEIARRQAERLTATAEETGRRRLADAALLADQERRRAHESIRAEIADAAARIAERNIREKLTGEDQRVFVHRFLQDVGGR